VPLEDTLRCPSGSLPIGQLGKGHAEILVPAGKSLHLVVAVVHNSLRIAKIVGRDEVHQLGEYGTTRVHDPSPSANIQKYGSP